MSVHTPHGNQSHAVACGTGNGKKLKLKFAILLANQALNSIYGFNNPESRYLLAT